MPEQADVDRRHPRSPGAGASLDAWLAYLESIHPTEIDLGLDRVLTVLRRLFRQRPKARIVTIGGTNGKGSTLACLEALLLASGRSVGAYTSPHLHRYNERVRVNRQDVSDEDMVAAFERVEQARGQVSLTYFEFGTLAAFLVFADKGVEDWLLEVGLGGRLDAVNVMDADLAIVTSVDIDHTSYLGNDRETIGFEKAGILRHGKPAIYGDMDPPRSVLQQVAAQRIELKRLGEQYRLNERDDRVILEIPELRRSLTLPRTTLPATSMAAAVMAGLMLEPGMNDATLTQALGQVRIPGRMEKLGTNPDIYLDVAHNPHAARWLASRLEKLRKPGSRILAVYGCLEDKDTHGVLGALADTVDVWFLGGLSCPRGLAKDALQARFRAARPDTDYQAAATVAEALENARVAAAADDTIIVFGSFFTVADARDCLGRGDQA